MPVGPIGSTNLNGLFVQYHRWDLKNIRNVIVQNLENMSKEKFWKVMLGLPSGLLLQQQPDQDQKQTLQKYFTCI